MFFYKQTEVLKPARGAVKIREFFAGVLPEAYMNYNSMYISLIQNNMMFYLII